MPTATAARSVRTARVGDLVPSAVLDRRRARRIDATALLIPGRGDINGYREGLAASERDFAAWDGVVVTAHPDGASAHRLLIVDRYRQVYAVHDADESDDLPSAGDLEEWFRFLATACPECGVIDDPLLTGPTP